MSRYPIQRPVWSAAIAPPPLAPTELHIWRAQLPQSELLLAQLQDLLASDERERAQRLRFAHHQNRAIASRGILRLLLAGYVNEPAAQLTFTYSDRGKPSLVQSPQAEPIYFNVTHSEDLALFAIAPVPTVGIDVEIRKPMPFLAQLIQRYCAPSEQAAIAAQPPECQETCFFYHWTTKEALTKATGQGITDLDKVQLQLTATGAMGIYAHRPSSVPWQVQLIEPEAGYAGAIAYAAETPRSLQFFDWQFPA